MKRSDKALTFALCASLTVHAWVGALAIRERVTELMARLISPPRTEADAQLPEVSDKDDDTNATPVAIVQPAQTVKEQFDPPPPPPPAPTPKEQPTKPPMNQENLEWGEKNAKGFAITSAPGKEPLRARKGVEDQSFASRDPEGPELFPDEPSLSTARPGEGGHGPAAMKELLKDKGTQISQPVALGPAAPMVLTPPTPKVTKPAVASSSDNELDVPQTSGQGRSQLPAAQRRSPAQANTPVAQEQGLPNDQAWGDEVQILPIKSPRLIGLRSNKTPYPEIVAALTRPPGLKISDQHADPLLAPALPNRVTADVPRAPAIQPATAALEIPVREIEQMAQRLGENDPLNAPAVVEAMTDLPADKALEGGAAALPEIAMADQPGSVETQDAIVALPIDAPHPEAPAEQVEQGAASPKITLASAQASQNAKPSANAGLVGPPVAAADPAADTGLESDPFSKLPGVEFNNGKVEARSGRQIKPIRPRLSEAGKRDLLAHEFPTVLLKVRIDRTGKVVDVNIVQGSGSEAVDMPVYRALWDWWFEPPRDKKGNPLEDVQLVAIHWG